MGPICGSPIIIKEGLGGFWDWMVKNKKAAGQLSAGANLVLTA
jgi:hypothetical protein